MKSFDDFKLNKFLNNAIVDLEYEKPTPIQSEAFPVVRSGSDVVGISQTGTGKTVAYLLPILQDLNFSKQHSPRVLILVPTRELVIQVVDAINKLAEYLSLRVYGAYGGVNIKGQKEDVIGGTDVVVATPGRIFDLAVSFAIPLKDIKKLVIDEVDVMLDLGFRTQLKNLFDLLPDNRQNIMFSATMTKDVDDLIDTFFRAPKKIAIAISGEPLKNINQACYQVKNYLTKVNLLRAVLSDKEEFAKVVVFISSKKLANRLYEQLEINGLGLIHSDKSQNSRIDTIELFDKGDYRVLIATDVIARGLDFDKVSHVINFDVPTYPENYIHRIGRSGRAEEKGNSLLFYTEKETEAKEKIEELMKYEIPEIPFPGNVEVTDQLIFEERESTRIVQSRNREKSKNGGDAFHDKSEKNSKTNQGGSYHREIASKYKKNRTRGDKGQNLNKKNKNKSR